MKVKIAYLVVKNILPSECYLTGLSFSIYSQKSIFLIELYSFIDFCYLLVIGFLKMFIHVPISDILLALLSQNITSNHLMKYYYTITHPCHGLWHKIFNFSLYLKSSWPLDLVTLYSFYSMMDFLLSLWDFALHCTSFLTSTAYMDSKLLYSFICKHELS
jgi:hypothetical protein